MFPWPSIETNARAKASDFKRDHQMIGRDDPRARPRIELELDIKLRVRLRPKFLVAISITQ